MGLRKELAKILSADDIDSVSKLDAVRVLLKTPKADKPAADKPLAVIEIRRINEDALALNILSDKSLSSSVVLAAIEALKEYGAECSICDCPACKANAAIETAKKGGV